MKKKIDLKFIDSVFKSALEIGSYKITMESRFEEVPDWDSLGHMRIISELEKRLKIEFEIEEIVDIDTVKKFINLIQKKI